LGMPRYSLSSLDDKEVATLLTNIGLGETRLAKGRLDGKDLTELDERALMSDYDLRVSEVRKILSLMEDGVRPEDCESKVQHAKLEDAEPRTEVVIGAAVSQPVIMKASFMDQSVGKMVEYEGGMESGKAHGDGTGIYENGNKYVGQWKNGKRHGEGTYVLKEGGKYFGEWKDGKPNGTGTHVYPDGGKYVGDFVNSKKHGKGTEVYKDGDKYVGDFADGIKHGKGTYFFADGRKRVGVWKDDKCV